jgi:hypothetical protein
MDSRRDKQVASPLVDGEWIPDLLARENVWNRHRTLNSVIEVRA